MHIKLDMLGHAWGTFACERREPSSNGPAPTLTEAARPHPTPVIAEVCAGDVELRPTLIGKIKGFGPASENA